ncbi:MAG: hypothetical protein HYZ13_12880 [Acidobacteria bacterium]|nr:hypothetical protein [Acidobacteriota bacterium]
MNEHGQLGDGTTQDRALPSPIPQPPGQVIRSLAAGEGHSVLLTRDGRLFASGRNDRGQLGNGSTTASVNWIEVKGIDRVIQVACGLHHTYALLADGSVWGWGDNRHSQVSGAGETSIKLPKQLPLTRIRTVISGATHGLALTEEGGAWGWGDGRDGVLGAGSKGPKFPPVPLAFLPPLKQMAAGAGFTLALTRNGEVLAWGRNDHGQLGDGKRAGSSTPRTVVGLAGITTIAAGQAHSLAQGSSGRLWSWGDNNMGQLGHSAPSYATHPMYVGLPAGSGNGEAWMLAAGGFHTVIYQSGASIYGFGYNEFNQLGDWSYQNRRSPVPPRKLIP